jgi:hypothetical protein
MVSNSLEQLNKIMTVKSSLRQIRPKWLEQIVERQAFQAALTRAYATWASSNGEWIDYSFNEHFLTHRAAPLLIRHMKGATPLGEADLANIWAEQFTWFDSEMKQRHIAKLIPAITDFLFCMEAELHSAN